MNCFSFDSMLYGRRREPHGVILKFELNSNKSPNNSNFRKYSRSGVGSQPEHRLYTHLYPFSCMQCAVCVCVSVCHLDLMNVVALRPPQIVRWRFLCVRRTLLLLWSVECEYKINRTMCDVFHRLELIDTVALLYSVHCTIHVRRTVLWPNFEWIFQTDKW